MRIWKYIDNYGNDYKISNDGMIISLKRKNVKLMKLSTHHTGYKVVSLNFNGVEKSYRVHRLVAETFIPNPNNFPVVNHIDGNKQNNAVSNLEWCTVKENSLHASENGLHYSRKVICLTDGRIFNSIKEAYTEYSIPRANFYNHLIGQYGEIHGLNFAFLDENGFPMYPCFIPKRVGCGKPVKHINSGKLFNGAIEAANFTGVHYSSVISVCKGEKQSVKGNKFIYL